MRPSAASCGKTFAIVLSNEGAASNAYVAEPAVRNEAKPVCQLKYKSGAYAKAHAAKARYGYGVRKYERDSGRRVKSRANAGASPSTEGCVCNARPYNAPAPTSQIGRFCRVATT